MKEFFVLGRSIAHSCSPQMHRAAFDRMGLAWRYGRQDLDDPSLARDLIDSREYAGANVTMPYKPLALELADVVDVSARLAGGANVLSVKDGALFAYNVDGIGAVDSVRAQGVSLEGRRVVVCGTGPTSLAILHAAAAAGAAEAMLLGRNAARARESLDAYLSRLASVAGMSQGGLPQCLFSYRDVREVASSTRFSAGDYSSCADAVSVSDLVFDATPLGMSPGDPTPFDGSLLRSGQVVFDVVYGHGMTSLASAAGRAGCRFFDGEGMLAAQAVASELIWLDHQGVPLTLPPREMFALMKEAAGFQC